MGYPRKLLNPGEQVVVDVVPHWKYLVRPVVVVVVVVAGAVVALQYQLPRWAQLAVAGAVALVLLWLLARYLRWVTTSFVVTNQRLILRKGVLRRTGREILIDRLTDITYKQTLTDRLLRCGDILLESPGREGQERLADLPHPIRIQNEICRLVSRRDGAAMVPGGQVAGWPPSSYTPGAGSGLSAGAPAAGGPARGTVTGSGRVYAGAVGAGGAAGMGTSGAGDTASATVGDPTVAEQLSQLDDLRRRGVISRREFAAKKSELLSRM
ncbi:MAG TPA: PH domain-containing protein [Acidimicrobiales bacterium]|nr:PH domain-containing protein [Acidimicrobiales bacterium]